MKRTAALTLTILLCFAGGSATAGERYDRRSFFEHERRVGQLHDWRDRHERRERAERREWHERFGRHEFQDRRRAMIWPERERGGSADRGDSMRGYRHPDRWR